MVAPADTSCTSSPLNGIAMGGSAGKSRAMAPSPSHERVARKTPLAVRKRIGAVAGTTPVNHSAANQSNHTRAITREEEEEAEHREKNGHAQWTNQNNTHTTERSNVSTNL